MGASGGSAGGPTGPGAAVAPGRRRAAGRPTTGLRALDDLLGGLRVGDNVVWEIAEDVSVDPFVAAFVRARGGPGLAYLSFQAPPREILERLADAWDPERCLLLDCFTDGLGGGEEPFARFYRTERARRAGVLRVARPSDPSAVRGALDGVQRRLGRGGRFVFDGLTAMQDLWGGEAALAFFLRSCPRLYELGALAYWLLERAAHPASFRSRLAQSTQVVLTLSATDRGPVLKVVRAEGRPAGILGREVRYAFEDGRFRVVREAPGTRERIGQALRAARIARGLSQAELARRIGISPSALSQAERGRAGLAGETLIRAWEVLGVPSGLGAPPERPIVVARRGARPARSAGPGVRREDLAALPGGVRVALLTFAPGASGRGGPFRTKHREVVVV
ncbi:MAG TPA: helix-turn-helix transcriptional regulator, partial [Actinomycetota bacterium]|nr:helix-turn-helix transcriptional regulator [Actinomycetota bacterium]